jgi:hypothetical protein
VDNQQPDTLMPLPEDVRPQCDFPGCGRFLSRGGMGRHKAAHARKLPVNPNDAIVVKLRERAKGEMRDSILAAEKCAIAIEVAFRELDSTVEYESLLATSLRTAKEECADAMRGFNAALDDLVVLGVL